MICIWSTLVNFLLHISLSPSDICTHILVHPHMLCIYTYMLIYVCAHVHAQKCTKETYVLTNFYACLSIFTYSLLPNRYFAFPSMDVPNFFSPCQYSRTCTFPQCTWSLHLLHRDYVLFARRYKGEKVSEE